MKKILLILFAFFLINISTADAVNYLNSITSNTSGNVTAVVLKSTKEIKYSEGKLPAVSRVYFDIKDAVVKGAQTIPVNQNGILQIRVAQNAVKPEYITRVVVDLKKMNSYKIEISSDKKEMKIIFENNTTVAVKETATATTVKTNTKTNNKKVIAIDAGHGGKDPGAIFGGVYEKNINLDIAKRLKKLLEKAGYEVIMTRKTDVFVELLDRAKIANESNADLLIGIHNNSMPNGYKGPMTLYNDKDNNEDFSSKELAETVQKSMETLKTGSIGARVRNDLVVLKNTNIPCVISEVACMSNASELKLLKTSSFRQKAAKALFDAIEKL